MASKEIKYLVMDETGGEQILSFDHANVVPVETLDAETRKSILEDGDYESLFSVSCPVISMSSIFKVLDENGLLEPMLEECRAARIGMDERG